MARGGLGEAGGQTREEAMRGFRRGLILDAARRVFAEQGFEGASMRMIAAAAGCTTGAIYPLFRAKEEIYAALLATSLEALHDHVAQAVEEGGTARESLECAALAFHAYYIERPAEVSLGLYLWRGGIRPRGLSPALNADLNAKLSAVLTLIEQPLACASGWPPGEVRAEVAGLFVFLIGSLVVHHTGRMRMLGQGSRTMVVRHLDDLTARIEAAPTAQ